MIEKLKYSVKYFWLEAYSKASQNYTIFTKVHPYIWNCHASRPCRLTWGPHDEDHMISATERIHGIKEILARSYIIK